MSRRNWIEYQAITPRKNPNTIRATLDGKGNFAFDRETFQKLDEPEAMILLFDRSTRVIGLKPSTAAKRNAVMVRKRSDRSRRIVRSINFLRLHRIQLSRTVMFPHARIEDGVLLFDLRDTVEYHTTRHRPKKR